MSQKDELKSKLSTAKDELVAYLETLSPEQWEVTVVSEGSTWSIKDVVAHLVESEMGMSIQAYKARQGRETVPEGFDLDRWNAGTKKRMGEMTPETLLAKLHEVREETLLKFDTIEPHEWALQGRHPSRGVITVAQFYETIAGHQRGHLQDIQQALG